MNIIILKSQVSDVTWRWLKLQVNIIDKGNNKTYKIHIPKNGPVHLDLLKRLGR